VRTCSGCARRGLIVVRWVSFGFGFKDCLVSFEGRGRILADEFGDAIKLLGWDFGEEEKQRVDF
jgi:hypothetical protein